MRIAIKNNEEKTKIKNKNMPVRLGNKFCPKCKMFKPYSEFDRCNSKPSGYASHCKACKLLHRKNTKKHKQKYDKKYRQENFNRFKDSTKNYRQSPKGRTTRSVYDKIHRKTDIGFKLKKILRTRLSHALNGNYKSGSFVRDLNLTIPEYKLYLESNFYSNPITGEMMSWKNYGYGPGKWQIDHIDPLCSFNLEDRGEFLEACHWTNTQPLWYEDHLKKTVKELAGRKKRKK